MKGILGNKRTVACEIWDFFSYYFKFLSKIRGNIKKNSPVRENMF